ncbi:MAG: PTS cellobiose transporter subunit IIC [Bacillaceae bacterium]
MKGNAVFGFLERYFVPIAGKIGAQRHLVAIRDGFVAIMPLVIIGSIAILVNGLPIEGFQKFMLDTFGETWKSVGGNIWTGSFAILSLLLSFSVAYSLAKSYGVDGLSAGLVSFGSLIMISPTVKDGLAFAWTGAQGLFVSLIVALITTEIFRFLIQRNITIKMPAGVPDAVSRSFAALIPGLVVFVIVAFVQLLLTKAGISAQEWIFQTIQKPLQGISNTLPSAIVVAFLVHLLWFFGLHGTNILGPILDSIYLPALVENTKLYEGGTSAFSDKLSIITKPFFDVFVYMGGAGTTLALIVAIFLVAKSAQYRAIGRVTAPGGLFNINEPVLFGLPIVLNPLLLIPFVVIPVVLTITTYFAITWGWVPKTVVLVPWTMPPLFSGYLVTGGHFSGVVLQIFNFALAVLMYIPFIKVADNNLVKQTKKSESDSTLSV